MKIKNKSDISLSILLHVCLIGACIIYFYIKDLKPTNLTYVEVNFGLTPEYTQTRQQESKKDPEGERQALKAKDALPQLTKNSAPKVAQSEPQKDALQLKTSEKREVKKPEGKKAVQSKSTLKAQNTGTLDTKDYLKRKEEGLREVGEKAQTGQKKPNPTKTVGQKHSLDDLPRSPFESLEAANAKPSEAPTGDETGQNIAAVDAYKIYLRGELKKNWRLPDLSNYSSSLITIVSFTVNEYGYLRGAPKIVESSQNTEFDSLVLDAVAATFPVSNPPPKDVHPPQTFLAKYNSKDIN